LPAARDGLCRRALRAHSLALSSWSIHMLAMRESGMDRAHKPRHSRQKSGGTP
jgi:hypothetical protein